LVGPDKNIYLAIGDLFHNFTQASNIANESLPDGRGGILRISQDGKPKGAVFGSSYPLDLYFAYGIRNVFGLDFDPATGNLWDTENGPAYGDEINLVEPGFNSGWKQIQGIWEPSSTSFTGDRYLDDNMTINPNSYLPGKVSYTPELVNFTFKSKYSPPVITWKNPIGITSIKFLNSSMFGEKYGNTILVGDSWGRIYLFELSNDRKSLIVHGLYNNSIVGSDEEIKDLIWGDNFGTVTDIDVGPDGCIYVLSYSKGKLYKIKPN
jgi:glucose/arabinose dehydrogenase